MKSVEILDTTLRDGAQGAGISFSVDDRLRIAEALDRLGIPLIEAGSLGFNPRNDEFFDRGSRLRLKHAKLCAFGATRRKNQTVDADQNLQNLLKANTPAVSVFGKAWGLHVEKVLGTTMDENLSMIYDSCAFLARRGKSKRAIFDAEHFFEGYLADRDYALAVLEAAKSGGADTLVLCDTNGGTMPSCISRIVEDVCKKFPGVRVGIHCHNDSGTAVANTLMAVEAGATHVQGTFLGFGERCGNACLASVIPNLQLKSGYNCIPGGNLPLLTSVAREIAEIANVTLPDSEPYVGGSAFTHKAGMHCDGMLKTDRSFEHIPPEAVGNERRFLISEITGRTALIEKVRSFLPNIDKDSKEAKLIIDRLKQMEYEGYQFEAAQASFELVVRRELGRFAPSFRLVSYRIVDALPFEDGLSASATIKIRVDGTQQEASCRGNGPVNALDLALRQALSVFYPQIRDMRLVDYKVRVITPKAATAAMVRVLITSADHERTWTTVGVCEDIIKASWIALVDSIEYILNKEL